MKKTPQGFLAQKMSGRRPVLAHGKNGTAMYITKETHDRLMDMRARSGLSMSTIVGLLVEHADIAPPSVPTVVLRGGKK